MSAGRPEDMIQRYLDRVAGQLHDLSAEERSEILSDLRSHIDEAVGDPATASEAHVRNVLERLGDPVDLARESRDRHSDTPPPAYPQVYRRVNKSPGALEVVAIVLTALFWPIGVIVAWLSPRWLNRDKAVATLIPFVGLLLLVGSLFPVWLGTGIGPAVVTNPQPVQISPVSGSRVIESREPSIFTGVRSLWSSIGRLLVLLGFLFSTVGGPFISAIYLAIRLQPTEEVVMSDQYPASQTQRMGPVA